MKDLAKKAYEKFCSDTMPARHALAFDELPPLVQDAWVGVVSIVQDETKKEGQEQ